ncbi:MAG TPA: hypothetical protein VG860_15805 [Terriglobia bacterium]|jgi:hypothetical protein|nr:hypothetical protein [Terriglobia bacterium]
MRAADGGQDPGKNARPAAVIPPDLARYIVLWGPGILILIVLSYGFMRIAYHWIDRVMEVKRRQTDSAFDVARDYVAQLTSASKSQADALTRLATAVEHRDSLESYEHQEMLISLKALHRSVGELLPEPKPESAGRGEYRG